MTDGLIIILYSLYFSFDMDAWTNIQKEVDKREMDLDKNLLDVDKHFMDLDKH